MNDIFFVIIGLLGLATTGCMIYQAGYNCGYREGYLDCDKINSVLWDAIITKLKEKNE